MAVGLLHMIRNEISSLAVTVTSFYAVDVHTANLTCLSEWLVIVQPTCTTYRTDVLVLKISQANDIILLSEPSSAIGLHSQHIAKVNEGSIVCSVIDFVVAL